MEIIGKYNTATVYTDLIGEETISQILTLLNQEFVAGSSIRIMPDCHYGAGCVIGTTMTIRDKVVPNLVGVDIGCGMLLVELGKKEIDLKRFDEFIYENIPCGMAVNQTVQDRSVRIEKLHCYEKLKNKERIRRSMGSLGGGNHFIEIDRDEDGMQYLIIHTGSRNLGKQVAEYYQRAAIQYQKDRVLNLRLERDTIISSCKENHREQEIHDRLEQLSHVTIHLPMPAELCYLEGDLFRMYLDDMDLCQQFAVRNRELIARKICRFLKIDFDIAVHWETVHNYINMEDMILRKGAIAAYQDQLVLIPVNMRDGCIIGKGKSCKEYNYSAPHGAGRILSRSEANRQILMSDYEESMKGIYSSTVSEGTKDESPFAYKPMESIIQNIQDTVEIIRIIHPIYNFKCPEGGFRKKEEATEND